MPQDHPHMEYERRLCWNSEISPAVIGMGTFSAFVVILWLEEIV